MKKSKCVADLTRIPPDTLLTARIMFQFECRSETYDISSFNTNATLQTLIEIDSFSRIRELKSLIEPHAYALYIQYARELEKALDRPMRFFTTSRSPNTSPLSDYHSEPASPTRMNDHIYDDSTNSFLEALELTVVRLNNEETEIVVDDDDLCVYEYQMSTSRQATVLCRINLGSLIEYI